MPVHVAVVLRVLGLTEAIEVWRGQAGGDLDEHIAEGEGGQLRIPAGGRGEGEQKGQCASSMNSLLPQTPSFSEFSASPPPNSQLLLFPVLRFSSSSS